MISMKNNDYEGLLSRFMLHPIIMLSGAIIELSYIKNYYYNSKMSQKIISIFKKSDTL